MRRKEQIFKNTLILIVLIGTPLMLWWGHYTNKTFTKAQIDKMFEPITSRYGIRIVYEVGDDFFSDLVDPPMAAGPAKNSKVTPIRHRVLARYAKILKNAFAKYPNTVIKEYLSAIQFAGEIDDDGFRYGGTYDVYRHIIYLVNNGQETAKTAESAFHHEFSSLMLKRHPFEVDQWTEQNPKGFQYLRERYDTWQTLQENENISSEDKEDYEKGFVNSYGQTNLENDINTYSGMIFTYPKKFKKIMAQYPRVRGKFKVWLDFYHRIDPIFTEAYLLGGQPVRADTAEP